MFRKNLRAAAPRVQAVASRFMGLIVASMGVQFVLAGFKAFIQS
jgi:small neutral amino acid transporter SnatA (MarC family)